VKRRRKRRTRDEIVDELVRTDASFRRLKERLDAAGIPTGSDEASYNARTRILEEAIERHARRERS
jgi:hypothetical protein